MSPLLVKICKDLKLFRCPRSLAPTLVALPSMSLIPQLHSRRDRSDRECGDFCRVDRIADTGGTAPHRAARYSLRHCHPGRSRGRGTVAVDLMHRNRLTMQGEIAEKFAMARAPSPTGEARVLPSLKVRLGETPKPTREVRAGLAVACETHALPGGR